MIYSEDIRDVDNVVLKLDPELLHLVHPTADTGSSVDFDYHGNMHIFNKDEESGEYKDHVVEDFKGNLTSSYAIRDNVDEQLKEIKIKSRIASSLVFVISAIIIACSVVGVIFINMVR